MSVAVLKIRPVATTPQPPRLPRFAQLGSGHTRLSRRLGPVSDFSKSIMLSGKSIDIVNVPELILLVDLLRPKEGEYRLQFVHDVICQVMLSHGLETCTINVGVFSSRSTPPTEASVVEGSIKPGWLDLAAADDEICSILSLAGVKKKYSDSITEFIGRWVTEYSLRSIAPLKDEEVTAALRARTPGLYQGVIDYIGGIPGANVDTISHHVRTALVAPDEIASLLARQPPKTDRINDGSFERTMEIRSERAKRN